MISQDFLSLLTKNNLPIRNLTPLPFTNARNATQCYRADLSLINGQIQPIFIKRLRPFTTDEIYQQFCQEIDTLYACQSLAIDDEQLRKPPYGIPKLLTHSTANENAFFITPCYQGQTLKNLIKNKTLTFEQTIDIAISLCYVLDKTHCLGYLHGDIKPSNILITDNKQLILLDFGLSQSLESIKVFDKTTAGTPAYMSPEQLNGLPLTPQSDCYSVGVVLVELLTGQLPFFANDLHGWAVAHCQQPVPTLPDIKLPNTKLSRNQQQTLQFVVDKLLAKQPDNRSGSLTDAAALLSRLAF